MQIGKYSFYDQLLHEFMRVMSSNAKTSVSVMKPIFGTRARILFFNRILFTFIIYRQKVCKKTIN